MEIRPILEKRWGHLQMDLKPVFERALHGPGTQAGWRFEPAGRIAYNTGSHFTPSLEYYSALGWLPTLAPFPAQAQVSGSGDWSSPGPQVANRVRIWKETITALF